MLTSPLFYVLAGGGLIAFFGIFYKLLRNPVVYWSAFSLSLLLMMIGLFNWTRPEIQHENGSLAGFMLLPVLFLCCFGICRIWFLNNFNMEPEIPFRWRVWIAGRREKTDTLHVLFGLVVSLVPFALVMLLMEFF